MVDKLVNYIVDRQIASGKMEQEEGSVYRYGYTLFFEKFINKNSNLKNIIKNKNIKKGDIIYFNNEGKGYSHAAIIYSIKGGTIRYSAHTDNY